MKTKKLKPACFVIELEVWEADILVVGDIKVGELPKRLKKLEYKKDAIDRLLPIYQEFVENEKQAALSVEMYKGNNRVHAIFFKNMEDSWEFWDYVIHEANHKTLDIMTNKEATKEYEAMAFTQVTIIKKIRQTLSKKRL